VTSFSNATAVRRLGAFETFLWLADKTTPKHFVVAADIKGETTIRAWRGGLDDVQRRHPLLDARVGRDSDGHLAFFRPAGTCIPLRVIPGNSEDLWASEMEAELDTPFRDDEAPLLRATLLHTPKCASLILSVHHSIGDGMSAAYLIRDLLQAISGDSLTNLPMPQSQEILLHPRPKVEVPPPVPNAPVPRSLRNADTLKVRRRQLSPGFGDRLRRSAREAGTTVHGLVVAALVLSGRQSHAPWTAAPVRVFWPVSTRQVLGAGEEFGFRMVVSTGRHHPVNIDARSFWEIAKGLPEEVAPFRTPEGLAAIFEGLEGFIASKPGVSEADAMEQAVFGGEMMISNLGVLPFGPDFGSLSLEAFWGPAIFVGFEGEQMVGVATHRGSIHLLHSSYTPIEGLLDHAVTMLERFAV
jgi:hypothetical protein